MADGRAGAVGRGFRETESVEDAAAWLRERVRIGELSEERLRFASWLGFEPATRLLDNEPPPDLSVTR